MIGFNRKNKQSATIGSQILEGYKNSPNPLLSTSVIQDNQNLDQNKYLRLVIESRVIKLQRLARSIYYAKSMAARFLQKSYRKYHIK